MAFNPATPDAGVYVNVDTLSLAGSQSASQSERQIVMNNDGVLVGAWRSQSSNAVHFYYSTDNGSSWTKTSSTHTPNASFNVNDICIAYDSVNDQYFYRAWMSDGNNRIGRFTFSGTDVSGFAVATSHSSYDSASSLIVNTNATAIDTWSGGTQDCLVGWVALNGAMGVRTFNAPSTWGTEYVFTAAQSYAGYGHSSIISIAPTHNYTIYEDNDADMEVFNIGNNASNRLLINRRIINGTTSMTNTQSNPEPTGWAAIMTSQTQVRHVVGWYDGTNLWAINFYAVGSAGEFYVAKQTPASWSTTWTAVTNFADDASNEVTAGLSAYRINGVWNPVTNKVLIAYEDTETGNDQIVYTYYDPTDDSTSGWSTFDYSDIVYALGVQHQMANSSGSYVDGIAVWGHDDSSNYNIVFNALAFGGLGSSWGFGIIPIGG